MTRPQFQPEQAKAIAQAFEGAGVDYLFIGKGAAILLGFPAMTQDVDVFPARTPENGARLVAAVTRSSVDRLGLETGGRVSVYVKATELTLGP